MIKIIEVKTKEDLEKIYGIYDKVYSDSKYFVYPIKKDYLKYIQGENNDLADFPHKTIMAIDENGSCLGRLVSFIDTELNKSNGLNVGYIAEYEAIDDLEVSKKLLDGACEYLKEQGMDTVKGPVSLPGGDDNRGFIIDNFDRVPSIMNKYNPPYYNDHFVAYGFEKYHDVYAYRAEINELEEKIEKLEKLLPKIEERYGYRVDSADMRNNLDREAESVYHVLDKGLPEEWEDFRPVTKEEITNIVNAIKPYADEDLIMIARSNEGEPIGFSLALPDYNEILKDFKGKLGVIEGLKFLKKKKSIERVRVFVLFVIPEYRDKGVTSAMYFKTFKNAAKKGYRYLEGSTIWDYNTKMQNDIEKFGATKDITYRIYRKNI